MPVSNPLSTVETSPSSFWTRANIGEATPDVLSPLCWSVWEEPTTLCFLRVLRDIGVVSRGEVRFDRNPDKQTTAAFYGRQATNVDYFQGLMARIPGVSAADYERDVLGSVREDFVEPPSQPWRVPIMLIKVPLLIARSSRRTRALSQETTAWWRSATLSETAVPTGARATNHWLSELANAATRFAHAEYVHMANRFLLSVPQGSIVSLAKSVDKLNLVGTVFSGYGGVAETSMADDAWRVANGELKLNDFIADYGFHGPNEGNVYTQSWRENPRPLETIIRSYIGRSPSERPKLREAGTVAARLEAQRTLRTALPRSKRSTLAVMTSWAGRLIRDMETTKAAFLMCLDVCRFAARQLGKELVNNGTLDTVDDVFFFDIPELRRLVAGTLPKPEKIVAERREERVRFAAIELPLSWKGVPVPLEPTDIDETSSITGAAGSAGTASGRARVVLDPNDDVEIEEGEILVCRTTDPSWSPLFALAEALVIDSGGPASHGAIVARELGIPCVIGTQVGTRLIATGDELLVNGDEGVVTVVSRIRNR